ncbi:MAG: hypothetical protein KHX03_09245 [Clostridium sp.]|nr:hypothetical protein [Clostridium sp.]
MEIRQAFLGYFKAQLEKKEKIDINTLLQISQDYETKADEVLKELFSEGLIVGVQKSNPEKSSLLKSYLTISLTPKGIKHLGIDSTNEEIKTQNISNENTKLLNVEKIIEKEKNRISQLSNEGKNKEIIEKILSYFKFLNTNIHNYPDGKIKSSEIKEEIKNIVSKYYESIAAIKASQITNNMKNEGYITFIYQKNTPERYEINSLLTSKGASYLEQLEKDYKEKFENYCKENNIKFPDSIGPNAAKFLEIINNSQTQKALEVVQNFYKNFSNEQLTELIKNANIAVRAAQSIPNINPITLSHNVIDEAKEDKEVNETKDNKEKTYTFEGILGQNCGEIVQTTGEDEKRIQIKGFKVKDGIRILRGFAKSSILAEYSKPDNNYQRNENNNHLNSLKSFMKDIKTSAKYLPEVTLVARGYQKLEPMKLSGKLSDTQQGELENLEYWKLTVNKEQLFRIDGNHRLEATKNKDYYIPFSIIIWENNPNSLDDEAFLFYFLNSKAKKLETEENLKGLVNAKTWNDKELENANILLPYIRHFKYNFEDHKLFNKTYYKDKNNNENAKTQILNVLEVIQKETDNLNLPFDIEAFEEYIKNTQEIISQKERFKYLRKQFRNFPQFVFYTLYKKDGDVEEALRFINATNKWAEFYKHDSNSFIYPNKMFYNAEKQLGKKINIFVAMPYYNNVIVTQFNKTFTSMVDELKQEEELLKDKLNLYPIMTYKAESTDILANMDKQIGECDIFVADISNHGENKVNPNVMFELGRVYDKKNFILIRNQNNDINESAFDIKHIDYVPIDFGMGFDTSIKNELKPRILHMIKNIIGFC